MGKCCDALLGELNAFPTSYSRTVWRKIVKNRADAGAKLKHACWAELADIPG